MSTLVIPLLLAACLTPSEGTRGDTLRYRIRIGEMPIGHSVSVTSSDPSGTVRRREESAISLKRGGQEIDLAEEVLWVEDAGGGLASVEIARTGMGPGTWVDRLRRIPEGWRRERIRATSSQVDTLRGGSLLGPTGIERALRSVRDSIEIRAVDTETMRPALYGIRLLRVDTLSVGPERIACAVLAVTDSADAATGQPPLLQWRDSGGALWREMDEGLGSVLERSATPAPPVAARRFDAISWRTIPLRGDPPAGPPCGLLLLPAGDPSGEPGGGPDISPRVTAPPIPAEEGQEVSPGPSPGSWRVRVNRAPVPPTAPEDKALWIADPSLAQALASDLIVDSADPAVREFARAAVEGRRTPTEEALALERAVHEAITVRDLGTVFATASQTLGSRRGDCTEHAVLLAACCRSRGIPARLVAGIVPAADQMLFHLWTEVFLNRWCSLDATLGGAAAPPCAIALLRWEHLEEGAERFNRPFERLAGRYVFQLEDRSR